MRVPSLALLLIGVLSVPVFAVDIVEMKDGRVLEAEEVTLKGDKLYVKLYRPAGDQTIAYSIPIEKIVPEFVYYAWADGIDADDTAEMFRLAAWSRGQGLFRLAWRAYQRAAAADPEVKDKLEDLRKEMYAEEAGWLLEEAWRRFRDNDVAAARVHTERLLRDFADSEQVGRAKGLLNIIKEREQFLDEQKKQEEIAARARRQKRIVDRHVEKIEKADRLVLKARFKYLGDAKHKLNYAAYVYRTAALEFADMLAYVEVDELRFTLKALLDDLDRRLVRTFLKLGDLRYLTGDAPGALDAVHEVLSVDPGNKAAEGLRERVLDAGRAASVVRESYPVLGIGYRYPYAQRYGRRLADRRYRPRGYHAPYVATVNGFGVYVPGQSTFRFSYYR